MCPSKCRQFSRSGDQCKTIVTAGRIGVVTSVSRMRAGDNSTVWCGNDSGVDGLSATELAKWVWR